MSLQSANHGFPYPNIPVNHIDAYLKSARRQDIGQATWGKPFWDAFMQDLEAGRQRQVAEHRRTMREQRETEQENLGTIRQTKLTEVEKW